MKNLISFTMYGNEDEANKHAPIVTVRDYSVVQDKITSFGISTLRDGPFFWVCTGNEEDGMDSFRLKHLADALSIKVRVERALQDEESISFALFGVEKKTGGTIYELRPEGPHVK